MHITLDYWLVARADTLRRPAVAAVVAELRAVAVEVLDPHFRRAGQ